MSDTADTCPIARIVVGRRYRLPYDYYQDRCAEAGMTPDDAAAAWDLHVPPDFARELVEAEALGPNAMRMLDDTILRLLQIAPSEPPAEEE